MDKSALADPHWWTSPVDRAGSRPVAYPSARRGRTILTAAIASTPTCRGGSYGPFCVRRVSSPPWVPSSSSSWALPRSESGRWCCAASARATAWGAFLQPHPRSVSPRLATWPNGPARYVAIRGRIDAEDEFEDDAHRPLVLRRARIQLRTGSDWVTVDAHTTAVGVRGARGSRRDRHRPRRAGRRAGRRSARVGRNRCGRARPGPARYGARGPDAPGRGAGLLGGACRGPGRAGARRRRRCPPG